MGAIHNRFFLLRIAAITAGSLLLVSCASAPSQVEAPPELAHFPPDAHISTDPALIDRQLFLSSRGVYLNRYHQLNYFPMLAPPTCPVVEIEGHRGGEGWPENSLSSIRAASYRPFNSIEVDLVQARGNQWLVHHDQKPGRTTYHPSGQNYNFGRSDESYWSNVYHLDPVTGDATQENIATLEMALKAFTELSRPDQTINFEIKQKSMTVNEAYRLKKLINQYLPDSRYRISSMWMGSLAPWRELSGDIYLAIVEIPAKGSITKLQKDKGQKLHPYQEKVLKTYYRKINTRWSSVEGMRDLKKRLGPNTSIHMDIREYMADASVRHRAERMGLKDVATYTINGKNYHSEQLMRLSKLNRWPHRAITDEDPVRLCSMLGRLPPQRKFKGSAPDGQSYSLLPYDADIGKLDDQVDYLRRGVYLTWSGTVNSMPENHVNRRSVSANKSGRGQDESDFKLAPPDETMSVDEGSRIRLSLPRRQ